MWNKIKTYLVVGLVVTGALTFTFGYIYGYERTHHIASFPCLGCLGLNPTFGSLGFVERDIDHPSFVTDFVGDRPIFLHYRTDVCPACDEMEPTVDSLEDEYGDRVQFVHMNLDHATDEEVRSYDDYDIQTTNGRTGVPMFTILYRSESGAIMFSSSYGVIDESTLAGEIETALAEQTSGNVVVTGNAGQTLVELFVDTMCVNCPAIEEELMELLLDDGVVPIIYCTDADGTPGTVANDRQDLLAQNLTFIGHPWTIFGYGKEEITGWNYHKEDEFYEKMDRFLPTGENSSLDIELEQGPSGLYINYSGVFESSGKIVFFVQEVISRYDNHEGDPIPMLALDKWSVELGNGTAEGNTVWNGTDGASWGSLDVNNLAVSAVFISDSGEVLLTRNERLSVEKGLDIHVDSEDLCLVPSGYVTTDLIITNGNLNTLSGEYTIEADEGFQASINEHTFIIEPEGGAFHMDILNLLINHTDENVTHGKVTVMAIPNDGMILLGDKVTFEVYVRPEIDLPLIGEVTQTPLELKNHDSPVIEFEVTDASGVDKVEVTWFVCTDVLCTPTVTEDAILSAGVYTYTIPPIMPPYISLHYKITATDVHGNKNTTLDYDIEVEPHVEQEDTPFAGVLPITLVLLASMVVVVLIRRKRN